MIRRSLRSSVLCAALLLAACGNETPTDPGGAPPPAGEQPIASISLTPGTAQLPVGGTTPLQAVARDASGRPLAGRALVWSSSDEAVATVDAQGTVTGRAAGRATIAAAAEGRRGEAVVTVAAAQVPVASVTLAPALDTVEAWEPAQLAATLRDAEGNVLTGRAVRWSSSDPQVARVDSLTGLLTGVDRGTVTVTATSEGRSATATRVVVIRYRSVTAGTMHACDVASGGIVWCWGLNGRQGRIGSAELADQSHSSVPVRVPGSGPDGLRFTQISTFASHTCGLTTEGKAWCWGYNGWGQLGVPSSTPQSPTPVAVAGNRTFAQISVGAEHNCALTPAGEMYCWGRNDWRQFAAAQPASSSTPVAVLPEMRFSAVTVSTSFTCGVTVAGPTYCWGANGLGQLGDGSQISYGNTYTGVPALVAGGHGFRSIDSGQNYVCGLTGSGSAFCWGSNGGRLGNGSTPERSSPTAVSGGTAFAQISTGFGHTCGVALDRAVWCWGANGNGQLGAVAMNGSTVPLRAAGTLLAAEVSAAGIGTGSGAHTCAIAADRLTTYCWGRNEFGQLGSGTTTSPVAVNTSAAVVVGQKPLPH